MVKNLYFCPFIIKSLKTIPYHTFPAHKLYFGRIFLPYPVKALLHEVLLLYHSCIDSSDYNIKLHSSILYCHYQYSQSLWPHLEFWATSNVNKLGVNLTN